MLTRRTFLQTTTAAGLWPLGSLQAQRGWAQTGGGLGIRYGWDPDIAAPTEASLYVSPQGDDAANGSLAQPLRTVQRGVDLLATLPGGSLSIRGGIYRESLRLDALQGQPGATYRLHRHGQERVQISAADVLSGWQPCPAAQAADLGFAPEGVFVARLPAALLQHGSVHALNLHEAGGLCDIATDRADMSDPQKMGDQTTYHAAEFVLDTEDKITAIRDPRLAGLSQAQMQQVRVLIYHRPNLISAADIAGFDPARGLITLAPPHFGVQRSAKTPVMRYALQNLPTVMTTGQWIARKTDDDDIVIYLHPRDPAHLESAIEISTRPTCIDYGPARGVELFGLDVVRAAGLDRLDGICIRRSDAGDGSAQDLRIIQCRVGENFSSASRGYGAIYLRGANGVTIHATSIGPAPSSFGLFLSDCRAADLRFLHITKVAKSPARFFGLRQAILAFSLFEDSAQDAHSNKFNFYEGSDAVLVYGIRTRRVGGYATYQEASRIHFAFCELDCAPKSQGRALVSQNRKRGAGQDGADGSGDPVAGGTFFYWNNSLLADPTAPEDANSLALGPTDSSQQHAVHNNILHGGGFADLYRQKLDRAPERRSHNHYTGFSFWQSPRYGWKPGPTEGKGPVGSRPGRPGLDMRDIIRNDLAPLFPTFEHWDVDINGLPVDWDAAPIGCEV